MSTYRETGIKCLESVLKNAKNIKTLEKIVFTVGRGCEDEYKRVIYQTIGDIMKKKPLRDIITDLQGVKHGWDHHSFGSSNVQLDEQDDFLEHPFNVEEGIFECKCGSKRVFSYSKQTRSADEPMTTYAECVVCGKKWQYSG